MSFNDLKTQFDALEDGNISEKVAKVLNEAIARGAYKVGDRLPSERCLAESLEVSRVSVRAAIQNLKAQGIVTSVQGGGTRIAEQAPIMPEAMARFAQNNNEKIDTLIDMRHQLDRWAASVAIKAITKQQLNRMSRALIVLEDEGAQRAAVTDSVRDYRRAWTEAVGSPVFEHMDMTIAETLIVLTKVGQQQQRKIFPETRLLIAASRAYYEALAAQNLDAALAALDMHHAAMKGGYPRLLQDNDETGFASPSSETAR